MSKLNQLMNNNRFLLVLSFVLAIIIWFVVSIAYSPQTDRTISQIPVEISFSDTNSGYRAYSQTELFAKVDVNGKKYVVEQLGADSLVVSATVESVSSSGMYTLDLQARKKTSNADYTIVSISPSTVNVMIDVERQAEFKVSIDCVGATVSEVQRENENLLLEPTFVNEANSVLTVTGPESEVAKISYVTAVANVNEELSQSKGFTAGIVAYNNENTVIYDANSGISDLRYVTFSYETADITANVNLRKVVPLNYTTAGAPATLPKITLHEITGSETIADNVVNTIGIKGAIDVISEIKEITLDGTVDFSKIDPAKPMSYRFELSLPAIAGVTYDEYTNVTDLYFVAMVDSSDIIARSFDVPAGSIRVENLPEAYRANVQSALKGVTVLGPRSAVNNLSLSDLAVTVDGSAVTAAGAANLTPTITIRGNKTCWVAGSYQVVVEIAGR